MEPDNYHKNGSHVLLLAIDSINYIYFIFIKMFLYEFSKYGDIIRLYKSNNKDFTFDAESIIACHISGKIIDMSSFEDGLKLIKIDEI